LNHNPFIDPSLLTLPLLLTFRCPILTPHYISFSLILPSFVFPFPDYSLNLSYFFISSLYLRLAERIAEKQLQTKIKFSEPVYRSGLKQLTRTFELPRSTLTVVQGISAVCASNNRRDRRRAAGGERDFTQTNGTNSESNSVCLMNENSSNYNSMHNSTEDSPSRGVGVDIRNWLFIEQNVGDILVRGLSLLLIRSDHYGSDDWDDDDDAYADYDIDIMLMMIAITIVMPILITIMLLMMMAITYS
jgi:hypothetical protein